MVFPDHWPFSLKDIEKINQLTIESGLQNIICTEKDYVKLFEFKDLLNVDINAVTLKHVLNQEIEEDILSRML